MDVEILTHDFCDHMRPFPEAHFLDISDIKDPLSTMGNISAGVLAECPTLRMMIAHDSASPICAQPGGRVGVDAELRILLNQSCEVRLVPFAA